MTKNSVVDNEYKYIAANVITTGDVLTNCSCYLDLLAVTLLWLYDNLFQCFSAMSLNLSFGNKNEAKTAQLLNCSKDFNYYHFYWI